jgi:uncharacterized protein
MEDKENVCKIVTMKKYILSFTIATFLFLSVNSQNENALLWQISGNGLNTSSYVYGTIHVLPKDKFSMPQYVSKALEGSSVLITEINLNIPLKDQLEVAREMFLPGGKTYEDYLSTEEYKSFYKYLTDSMNLKKRKIKKIIRIKPFFASSLILKEYYGKIKSYEMEFKKLAKKNKLVFDGLESLQDQLDLLNSISLEEQFQDITMDLSSFREYNLMVDCYLNQDLECLQKILNEEEGIENFEEEFLNNRNENWMPKIENSIQEQSSFIAVGAGHLVGDYGVISLLRDKGYKVIPVYK